MSVLHNHPAYVAFEDEIVELAKQRDKALAEVKRANDNFQQSLKTTKVGDPLPPPPAGAHGIHSHHRHLVDDVKGRQSRWVAENYEALEAELHASEDKVVERAAELLAEFDELAGAIDELGGELQSVRKAAGHGWAPIATGGETLKHLIAAARRDQRILREPRVGELVGTMWLKRGRP